MTTIYRKRLPLVVLVALALLAGTAATALFAGRAAATPGSGVTPYPITFGDLEDSMQLKFKGEGGYGRSYEVNRIALVRYVIEPGGVFGWHRHAGPVWAIVTEGALTLYDSDDASCQGETVQAGAAFLDEGPRHIHNARNEGEEPVVVYATFMLPEDGDMRLDAANPGVCPF